MPLVGSTDRIPSKRKAHSSDWAADHYLNTHTPLPNYPRGSYDPFQTGYSRHDQWNVRRRYSPPYAGGADAGPSRQLPGISTLPAVSILPNPSAPPNYTAAALISPAAALSLESSLPPVMRSPFSATTVPELQHTRAWPQSSPFGDKTSFGGRRQQHTHECGNPAGLEHYQHVSTSNHFPSNDGYHQESPNPISHDDRYGHRPSVSSGYDPTDAYSHPDFRQNSSVSSINRSITTAPRALLPPIVPGPYGNGTHIESALSASHHPETTLEERAAQPRLPHNRLDGTPEGQQPHTTSRRPGPQV